MDLWLKLGEALQANADDERAIVALSHVTHHPYTRFLTGNDNQRIFEEIISSARLALASSFANSPNNDTYMSRELYTWLEKHPLYAHIVESWKTKMRSEIESFPSFITPNPDELVQLYIRAANLQRGDGMGGVDAQVQNGKMMQGRRRVITILTGLTPSSIPKIYKPWAY